MIEHVVKVSAKFSVDPLRDRKVLVDTEIYPPSARTVSIFRLAI